MAANKLLRFLEEESDNEPASGEMEGEATHLQAEAAGVFIEIKKKMTAMQLELEDKQRSIDGLHEIIQHQKQTSATELHRLHEERERALMKQKSAFEESMKRQMEFARNILREKEELSEHAESLIKDLKQVKEEGRQRLERVRKQENERAQQAKERWKTTEKIQRERWMEETKVKVKQDTIRALEPEVQRLIDTNETNIRRLKKENEDALEKQAEGFRKQLSTRLQETLVEQEKKLAIRLGEEQQRLEKLIHEARTEQNCTRRKLQEEHEKELRRLEQERLAEREAFEEFVGKLTHKPVMVDRRVQHGSEADEKERADELRMQLQREHERLKDVLVQERDREIAIVIDRLGKEEEDVRKKLELQKLAHEEAMREAAEKEDELRERVRDTQLQRCEAVEAQRRERAQRETLRNELNELNEKLVEAKRCKDSSAREHQILIEGNEQEVALLRRKLERETRERKMADEERDRLEKEMQRRLQQLELEKELQVQDLDSRVRRTLLLKEKAMEDITAKLESKDEQLRHLQALLQKEKQNIFETIS